MPFTIASFHKDSQITLISLCSIVVVFVVVVVVPLRTLFVSLELKSLQKMSISDEFLSPHRLLVRMWPQCGFEEGGFCSLLQPFAASCPLFPCVL